MSSNPRHAAPRAEAETTRTSENGVLADARLRAVLDVVADFYWEQDEGGRLTFLQARDGFRPEAMLDALASQPPLRAPAANGDAGADAADEPRAFHDIVRSFEHAELGTRRIAFSGAPIRDAAGNLRGYAGIARDVTERARTERFERLELTIARVLAETDGVDGAVKTLLFSVCEAAGWRCGRFFGFDASSGLLIERGQFGASAGEPALIDERAGLPSWLPRSGEPLWVAETSGDSRFPSGASGAALFLPVKAGRAVVGVLEFRAFAPADAPDEPMTRVLRVIGAELGHFYDRTLTMDRLRESEERFSSTMEFAAIGIAHVASDGRFIYVNPQICEMLGYTEQELLALTVRQITHPDDVALTDEYANRLRSGVIRSFKVEKRYVRKDGLPLWVSLTIAAKRDASGRALYNISIVEDISARKRAEERIQYLATHDGLTGLPNRAMFTQLLGLAIESGKRYGRSFAVLFIDLDRFKVINDTLGHEAGDVLLREMSARLRDCLRASDVVARLGGDEFVALLHDVPDVAAVEAIARQILATATKPVAILGQECRVTASIGASIYPRDGRDEQTLMKNADMAMYSAKEEGKNNCQFWSPSMRAQSLERLTVESGLRGALERGELRLHYQAKVKLGTGQITGVEALCRWRSPELGDVSPAQFIPVAEETGLIVPLGRWVLHEACRQNAAWQRQGLPPVCVSVNLSMRQLNDESLVSDVAAALRESGLPAHLLELEVTESMIMQNGERAVNVLSAIKKLGVRLAIDDFGTGYSSLAQLRRFPIDTLKVDRSFIRRVPEDAEDRAIAEAIIAMGRTLNLTIVAEGVETPEQQAFLTERACDEMQGYHFSTPVEPERFAALLRRQAGPG